MKETILIVEDDKYILNFITISLKNEAYELCSAKTVKEAIETFYQRNPSVIILDLGLPDGDGIEVIQAIREVSQVPILVVSARQEEAQKIQALDHGADDYVTKPFSMGELMARIRVALCKGSVSLETHEARFEEEWLKVDYTTHQVWVDQTEVHLTPIEFKILKLLIDHRGKVLTHNYILSEVWGYDDEMTHANLRVFMATLRRKIEKEPGNPRFILTEVGVGYRFAG